MLMDAGRSEENVREADGSRCQAGNIPAWLKKTCHKTHI